MFVVQFLEECTYRSKYGNSHIYKNTKPDSNMKRVFFIDPKLLHNLYKYRSTSRIRQK